MLYHLVADLLVLLHLAFIVFAIVGGFAVLRWPWLVLLHIPAVVWAVAVEINGWLCPLTPWENSLRHLAGQEGYSGGFVEYYIIPLIYPMDLTHNIQIVMGSIVVLVNLCVYCFVVYRFMQKHKERKEGVLKTKGVDDK